MLDKKRINVMAEMGIPAVMIAKRLDCSERQVRRILGRRIRRNALLDKEKEVWQIMAKAGWSQSEVAYAFGVSRQAVSKFFKSIGGE